MKYDNPLTVVLRVTELETREPTGLLSPGDWLPLATPIFADTSEAPQQSLRLNPTAPTATDPNLRFPIVEQFAGGEFASSHARMGPAPSAAEPTIADAMHSPTFFSTGWKAFDPGRTAHRHAGVVFLGDSITAALAGSPSWSRLFAPMGAVDFGVAGITTDQVFTQVQSGEVAAATPNRVVLMIGTNNLGYGQSPAKTAAGIRAIVDALEAQLPSARIVVVGPLPRGHSPTDPLRQKVAEVNRLIAPLASSRVTVLDVGRRLLEADGTISPAIMPDYLHPSWDGYDRYTPIIRAALRVSGGDHGTNFSFEVRGPSRIRR